MTVGHEERNGVQIGSSYLQSRLVVFVYLWISVASSTQHPSLPVFRFLLLYLCSFPVHLVFISLCMCCCAIFSSLLLTAELCSIDLFHRFLPVLSIYDSSQFMHGILYTTPFLISCLSNYLYGCLTLFVFCAIQSQLMKVHGLKHPETSCVVVIFNAVRSSISKISG